jgi:hypothetical protein
MPLVPAPTPLPAGTKTNITAVATALDAAMVGLNPNDRYQAAVLRTLREMRRKLDRIAVERAG